MFGRIIPFCYLQETSRAALLAHATEHQFAPGTVFVHEHDAEDKRVFLLLEGLVGAFDADTGREVSRIGAGHYFGERAALFAEKRNVSIRAIESSRVLAIDGERFLALFLESPAFAQGMANVLRHKQGIFVGFERFMAQLLGALGSGEVHIEELLPRYQALEPALHAGANSEELDFSGLLYAVRRLPDNVTRCFAYYLTETLPHHQARPDEVFSRVATAARRRATYELLPGKDMLLIREGISDVVDFITCLCLFVIEARKLRRRMLDFDVLRALTRRDSDFVLPFSPNEMTKLERIWPEDTQGRLRDILLHHEDLHVSVFRQLDNYGHAHSEAWTNQIADATKELLGAEPALLPAELEVHVVSSNTHSVANCLSPWLSENANAILGWGRDTNHPLSQETWFVPTDACYALARDYFRAHPDRARERSAVDREAGILPLEETAFTGIAVQLVDLERLRGAGKLDPKVPNVGRGLLINIDYAFGQQAEHIIANLISLFGHRIKSINVLGKAGALQGQRGDILATTAFIEQSLDLFQPVPNNGFDVERLRSLTDRTVHVGPVLTVSGTLLQNRRMLHFNKHVWGCTGLEMEGTYYLAQILESANRGVLSRDVALRFLYYVSDLPLDHTANLSGALLASEGVPPLYAVTREILCGIAKEDT